MGLPGLQPGTARQALLLLLPLPAASVLTAEQATSPAVAPDIQARAKSVVPGSVRVSSFCVRS